MHPLAAARRAANESAQNKEFAARLQQERAVFNERFQQMQQRCDELAARAATAEEAQVKTAEKLSVALAERNYANEALSRADATITELRELRAELSTKCSEAQSECAVLQRERASAAEVSAQQEKSLAVAQAERRLLHEHATRTSATLEQCARAAAQYKAETDGQVQGLTASRDALRAEKMALQQSCAAADAERVRLVETIERLTEQSAADLDELRKRLALSEARAEEALSRRTEAEEEKLRLREELAVALAEKKLLTELTGRMTSLQMGERAAHRAAEDRELASRGEMAARLEMAEQAARSAEGRLMHLEADRRVLAERYAQANGALQVLQSEHRRLLADGGAPAERLWGLSPPADEGTARGSEPVSRGLEVTDVHGAAPSADTMASAPSHGACCASSVAGADEPSNTGAGVHCVPHAHTPLDPQHHMVPFGGERPTAPPPRPPPYPAFAYQSPLNPFVESPQ